MAMVGCACGKDNRLETSFTKAERVYAKSLLKVTVEPENTFPDLTSTQITHVSHEMAVAKGLEAMQTVDVADAKAIGYDFPISSVWEPEQYTEQMVDGHQYYIALLGFTNKDQAAYDQLKGICPGIVVVDAQDPNKPAQVRLRNAKGRPYQIKLHYRDSYFDQRYIMRFLYNSCNIDVSGQDKRSRLYIDDILPEVEDGTWDIYYIGTYNEAHISAGSTNNYYFPTVKNAFVINAEDDKPEDLVKCDPKDVPKWADRVYSKDLVTQYINAWGYNPENWGLWSEKGRMVLDPHGLEVLPNAAGTELEYVGIMTSAQRDNSAYGVITVSTRTLKAHYYPLSGKYSFTTPSQVTQVINDALEWKGYHVEDMTLHLLYGHLTWVGSLVMHVEFPAREENEETITGATYAGCVLMQALPDANIDDVVWDEQVAGAYNKYEHHVFRHITTNVGSTALVETPADGVISEMPKYPIRDDEGTHFYFKLAGEKYKHMTFHLEMLSAYDPDVMDIIFTQVGHRVSFTYGDTRNSPTNFVKHFKNLTNPVR